jgi:hypothetical protein
MTHKIMGNNYLERVQMALIVSSKFRSMRICHGTHLAKARKRQMTKKKKGGKAPNNHKLLEITKWPQRCPFWDVHGETTTGHHAAMRRCMATPMRSCIAPSILHDMITHISVIIILKKIVYRP